MVPMPLKSMLFHIYFIFSEPYESLLEKPFNVSDSETDSAKLLNFFLPDYKIDSSFSCYSELALILSVLVSEFSEFGKAA